MLIATSLITTISYEHRPELAKTWYYIILPEVTNSLAVLYNGEGTQTVCHSLLHEWTDRLPWRDINTNATLCVRFDNCVR